MENGPTETPTDLSHSRSEGRGLEDYMNPRNRRLVFLLFFLAGFACGARTVLPSTRTVVAWKCSERIDSFCPNGWV